MHINPKKKIMRKKEVSNILSIEKIKIMKKIILE
jgi:hypothetical protein